MIECGVCYNSIEHPYYQCGYSFADPDHDVICGAAMCAGCAMEFFKYCETNTMKPRCFGNNGRPCKLEIIEGDLVCFSLSGSAAREMSDATLKVLEDSNALREAYVSAVVHYYANSIAHDDEVYDIVKPQLFLAKQREEKQALVQTVLPPMILYLAKMAMPHKLASVSCNARRAAKSIATSDKKRKKCYEEFCKGVLLSGGGSSGGDSCSICKSTFCSKCGVKTSSGGGGLASSSSSSSMEHVCDQNIIESMELIKQDCVPCPSCNTMINRSFGCNAMTCTLCGKHFNYESGEATSHGNDHNAMIEKKSAPNRFTSAVSAVSKSKKCLALAGAVDENVARLLSDEKQAALNAKWESSLIPFAKSGDKGAPKKARVVLVKTLNARETWKRACKLYKHYAESVDRVEHAADNKKATIKGLKEKLAVLDQVLSKLDD